MKKIHIILYLHIFSTSLISQNFTHLTLTDGLSQSTISSILQDKTGYLWFGTRNGLNRYDGYSFKVFREISGDTNSISDNWITSLSNDHKNNIWIGTLNHGVVKFDPSNEIYTRFDNSTSVNNLTNLSILSIYVDLKNTVWIGTQNGLNRIIDNKVTNYKFPSKFNTINHIIQKNDDLIFATENGVFWFDKLSGKLDQTHYLSGIEVHSLIFSDEGVMYIGTEDGLYCLDLKEKKISKIQINLSHSTIFSLVIDLNHNLWIGTFQGLNKFNIESQKVTQFLNDNINPKSLSDNEIRHLFVDNSNNLWIGTYGGGGVNKLDLKEDKFITVNQANTPSLSDNIIRSFHIDNDKTLWVGTRYGLNRKGPSESTFTTFVNTDNKNSISNNEVRKIIDYSDDELLIGTEGGVNILNKRTNIFKRIPILKDGKAVKVYSIFKDKNGNFWIGTNGNGIYILDKNLNIIAQYNNVHIPNLKISFIEEDSYGHIWIGSFGGGLYRVDNYNEIANIKFKIYTSDHKNPTSISNNVLYSFGLDINNNVWIGTTSGLNLYRPSTDDFTFYSKKHGLPDNYIYGIESDQKNQLWLSTVYGISRFDLLNNLFKNFDKFDGLQENEFKYNASYKSKDGTIYFGGVNGYNYFNPDKMLNNLSLPKMVITSVYKFANNRNGKIIIGHDYLDGDQVVLPYTQNEFTIEFSGLEFTQPKKNQYAYRMIGFNDSWNYSDYKRDATYTNLDPGEYIFEVKGSNNDGLWNSDGIRLTILIEPPFWQSIWFKVFIGILIIMISLGVYWVRIRNVFKQNKVLEKKITQHTEELKSTQDQLIQAEKLSSLGQMMAGITHEVNTPLAYVSSNLYVLTEIFEYHEKSVKAAFDEQTYANILQIIDSTNTGVEKLTSIVKELRNFTRMDEPIFVDVNLNQIVESAIKITSHRFKKNQIELEKSLDNAVTIKGLTNQLNQVVLNLLNNACDAVKSMREKNNALKPLVKVNIYKNDIENLAILEIEDNGIGIPKDIVQKIFDPYFTTKPFGKGTGLGLAISYSIVKSHKGNIDIESNVDQGAKITLSFPLPRKPIDE